VRVVKEETDEYVVSAAGGALEAIDPEAFSSLNDDKQ
jgi:hypothetical protein